eukprot:8858760-Pyramimonas_sp.AAC.2
MRRSRCSPRWGRRSVAAAATHQNRPPKLTAPLLLGDPDDPQHLPPTTIPFLYPETAGQKLY